MVLAIVAGIIVGGRYLMRPVFRIVAATRLREVFTAMALLLVIGIALAMQTVGLSPALGTFVAGVVLADNEYRHELEGDIAPFKGLLLGLFFLTVGASIDFRLLLERPWLILGLVLALVVTKLGVLVALGRGFRLAWSQTLLFGFALAQVGVRLRPVHLRHQGEGAPGKPHGRPGGGGGVFHAAHPPAADRQRPLAPAPFRQSGS
jgi:Kef-type K+ transport system membrane component KefB